MKKDNEKEQETTTNKELTPQQIQKRKKILVYSLLCLLFIGTMWLIVAPSGHKDGQKQFDGFNPELPVPKNESIVTDKMKAYEQEAIRNKQNEKTRSLQDFAFILTEGASTAGSIDYQNDSAASNKEKFLDNKGINMSAYAYKDINRQLSHWEEQPATEADEQAQLALEWRSQELERKLEEKSASEQQLDLIEKSYAIAAKYMPQTQVGVSPEGQSIQMADSENNKKVLTAVSPVQRNVVSLLSVPMKDEEFLEQYGKPRNMGFITATENITTVDKNSIRACVYKTVTVSGGKEIQLRLLETVKVDEILIPVHTILTGKVRIGEERLHITINSIQYAGRIIPVEMEVYDMDGLRGIFIPNSDAINAINEIAANMSTSAGSGITITNDAGSQLVTELGRNTIQGVSQFISKKMMKIKVTLKAGYNVLLLPKNNK